MCCDGLVAGGLVLGGVALGAEGRRGRGRRAEVASSLMQGAQWACAGAAVGLRPFALLLDSTALGA